jgi:hypothetical protein
MFLTLHTLAETYNVLPSEALGRATTFDLYVLDLHSKYQRHLEAKANGKATPGSGSALTEQQMLDMIERAKNFKPKERNK